MKNGQHLDSETQASSSSIDVLHDEVLLELFDFFRLESSTWNRKGWYKLAHTCRRWRHIIFSSPSRLHLQLHCTYGTPVADMLSHSPPFPLFVDYGGRRPLSANDEEGALLALQKHDRVRSIDLRASTATLDKLFAVMDGPFSTLKDLVLMAEVEEDDDDDDDEADRPDCQLPRTFQAPRLCHLDLNRVGDVGKMRLPLLASLSGLVSLALMGIPVSVYFPLEYLASRLLLMPQLEYLGLGFDSYIPADVDGDVERELPVDVPNAERISLLKLSEIFFKGDSSYLEGLAARIRAPLLTKFSVTFLKEPYSAFPHLSELLSAATELRFPVASIKFSGTNVDYPNVTICMACSEQTLDRWSQFAPFQILSTVERLHVDFDGKRWEFLQEEDDIAYWTWRDLLRPFCNVTKLQIDTGLMRDISDALSPYEGDDDHVDLLPKLRTLARPNYARFDAFDSFIAGRRKVGQHIRKCRRPHIPRSDSEGELDRKEDESETETETEDEWEDDEEEREGDGIVDRYTTDSNTDADTDTGTSTDTDNPDSSQGTNDDFGFSTELDSGPDLDAE